MPNIMNEGAASAIYKSVRSVFVGNIPYEATEEKLKDIFAEVGPVVSFKLVFDRVTGKPKGAIHSLFLLNFEKKICLTFLLPMSCICTQRKFLR